MFKIPDSKKIICTCSCAFVLAGCANQQIVSAENITLQDALVDTVKSLDAARGAAKNSAIALNVCSVIVKFNIDAKAVANNKLGLSAGPVPSTVIPVPLSGNASAELTDSGQRTNTVVVQLATANRDKASICKSVGGGGSGEGKQ